jgi:hypothetical protein
MILHARVYHQGLKLLALICVLLATKVGTSQAAVNLVKNPGFEIGYFTDWSVDFASTYVVDAGSGVDIPPIFGLYEAKSGPSTLGPHISQDITTIPGHAYEVSFWLAEWISYDRTQNQAYNTAEFQASFGGGLPPIDITTVITLQTPQNFPYTKYVFDVVATGTTSTLQFSFLDPPSYWVLDNVSVTDITPEASSLVVWSVLGLVGVAIGVGRRQRNMPVA